MVQPDMAGAPAGRERDALAWRVASTLRALRSDGAGTDHDHRAREHEAVRQLEAEAVRLAARVRQMADANRALRTANRALIDTNTELRRDTVDAQADTARAQADTAKARADTSDARTDTVEARIETADAEADTADAQADTVEAQADTVKAQADTADAWADTARARADMAQAQADTAQAQADTAQARADTAQAEARYEELYATVEEVERANAALQPHRKERQKLASVLEAKRAQLAVVLAGIEDAAIVVDDTGATVRANDAYLRMFGDAMATLSPDDAHGRPLAIDQTPRARAARGETFRMAFNLQTSLPSVTGEDTRRRFEATGKPFPESGVTHALLVIRDTTLSDRHRRMQDEFLVLAGHELRTPLTVLQGYVDLLQPLLGKRGDARARRYATRALHETRRLAALVRDLTDGARLQTGKLTLDLAPLDLTALAAEVVDATREAQPGPAIRLSPDTSPLWVRGDAGRLEQVLFNLLTNAITHAPCARPIDVRLRRVDAEVALEVQDHGRGIAAAHLPFLFSRFYQVARDDRPSRAGLGLGLFICEELVRAHGGHIAVASQEGAGTTFAVWLPLLDGETDGAIR